MAQHAGSPLLDIYGRVVAVCRAGRIDLSQAMAWAGYAVALVARGLHRELEQRLDLVLLGLQLAQLRRELLFQLTAQCARLRRFGNQFLRVDNADFQFGGLQLPGKQGHQCCGDNK